MDKNFQQEVLRRLDTLIKLQTLSSMKDDTQSKKIDLLNGAGFGPKEIADIIGTTSNSVSVALHKLKNKGTKKEEKPSENKSGQNRQDASQLPESRTEVN